MKITLEIDKSGNIHCLYTDSVDLFSLGRVTDVRKASNVEFCEDRQMWQVTALSGEVLYENKSREKAIEYEIKVFSPGGEYYNA